MARKDDNLTFGKALWPLLCTTSPDGNDYSESKDFSDTMWKIHHIITSIALLNDKLLLRWLASIVMLLPKGAGQPKIHRLRIINTYESDYNLILKYFWANKGMRTAKKKNNLGTIKQEGKKEMSTSETAVINEIILDIHRITQEPICSHQDD